MLVPNRAVALVAAIALIVVVAIIAGGELLIAFIQQGD
jgi:hypothetical protein